MRAEDFGAPGRAVAGAVAPAAGAATTVAATTAGAATAATTTAVAGPGCPAPEHRARPLGRFAAVAVLAAATFTAIGPGTAAHAVVVINPAVITVTPAETYLSDLTQFTVTTTITEAEADRDDATVTVSFAGESTVEVGTLGDVDGDLGGSFPATGAVCGENTVTLTATEEDEDPSSVTRSIEVLCPMIIIDPTTVPFSSEPTTVAVTGRGFLPNQPLQASIGGATAGPHATANAGGLVTFQLPVSGVNCSPHQVTVAALPPSTAANPAGSASAPFTVTGCPAPKLTANPDVVTGGSVTHVTGSGFTPNQPVTLSWQFASGAAVPGVSATTTANASGDIDYFLVVLLPDPLGPCELVATQGTTKPSTPVVDEVGSMEPSTDDQLLSRQ